MASFIGSPAMNLFEASLDRKNGHLVAKIGDHFLRLDPEALSEPAEVDRYVGRSVAVGLRPEHLEDAAIAGDAPQERRLRGDGDRRRGARSELIVHVEVSGRAVLTEEIKEVAADLDASAMAQLEAEQRDAKLPIVGRFDVFSRARPGQNVEMVVDTRRLHVFDLDTGKAVGGHPRVLAHA